MNKTVQRTFRNAITPEKRQKSSKLQIQVFDKIQASQEIETYKTTGLQNYDNLLDKAETSNLWPYLVSNLANDLQKTINYLDGLYRAMDQLLHINVDINITEREYRNTIKTARYAIGKIYRPKKEIKSFEENIEFLSNSFNNNLPRLKVTFLKESKSAQKNVDAYFRSITENLSKGKNYLLEEMGQQQTKTLKVFEVEVGNCYEINEAYKNFTNIICEDITPPINGYWFSVFCIIFCLVIIGFFNGWHLLKYFKKESQWDDLKTEGYESMKSIMTGSGRSLLSNRGGSLKKIKAPAPSAPNEITETSDREFDYQTQIEFEEPTSEEHFNYQKEKSHSPRPISASDIRNSPSLITNIQAKSRDTVSFMDEHKYTVGVQDNNDQKDGIKHIDRTNTETMMRDSDNFEMIEEDHLEENHEDDSILNETSVEEAEDKG